MIELKQVEEILGEVRPIVKIDQERQAVLLERGDHFNVFDVLHLGFTEKAHSLFIAELLNPNGIHNMGDEFLNAFIDSVNCLMNFEFNTKCAKVKIESHIGFKNEDHTEGGRLDIIITSDDKAIIIENKLCAKDQERQLLRYKNYVENHFKCYRVLYMSLYHYEPSDYSIEDTQHKKLVSNKDFFPIGYNDEILTWLGKCADIAHSRSKSYINKTIIAYINFIKEKTSQTMDPVNEKELLEIMMESENIDCIVAIINHRKEWKSKVIKKFLIPHLCTIAEKLGLKFKFRSTSSFYFYKDEWNEAVIYFIRDYDHENQRDYAMYCTITHKDNKSSLNNVRESCKKALNGWEEGEESQKGRFPFGWKYLDKRYSKWDYYAMKYVLDGTVEKDIKSLVEKVVEEIECRNLLP